MGKRDHATTPYSKKGERQIKTKTGKWRGSFPTHHEAAIAGRNREGRYLQKKREERRHRREKKRRKNHVELGQGKPTRSKSLKCANKTGVIAEKASCSSESERLPAQKAGEGQKKKVRERITSGESLEKRVGDPQDHEEKKYIFNGFVQKASNARDK